MATDPRNHERLTELDAALAAVQAASALTAGAQGRLAAGDTHTKGDESPVTVADFAAQAIVCATLTDALGEIDLVGEEDSAHLRSDERTALRDGVVELVQRQRADNMSASTVLDWISVGAADATTARHWTLDPIDGTKGFLRGDQYAIALALVEDGAVTLGVLGCPNLPNPDGTIGAVFAAGAALDGNCVAYYGSSTTAVPGAHRRPRFARRDPLLRVGGIRPLQPG